MSKTIIIIGAGLAGLSAALQAAENGCNVKLVSSLPLDWQGFQRLCRQRKMDAM